MHLKRAIRQRSYVLHHCYCNVFCERRVLLLPFSPHSPLTGYLDATAAPMVASLDLMTDGDGWWAELIGGPHVVLFSSVSFVFGVNSYANDVMGP